MLVSSLYPRSHCYRFTLPSSTSRCRTSPASSLRFTSTSNNNNNNDHSSIPPGTNKSYKGNNTHASSNEKNRYNMWTIGLTGGIASGKSNVAKNLGLLGVQVIDADLLGHEVYEPNTEGFDKVRMGD